MRANLHLSAERGSNQHIIVAILTPEQLLRPNIPFFSSTVPYNYFCTITQFPRVSTICPSGRHLEVKIYVDLSGQANAQEVDILH